LKKEFSFTHSESEPVGSCLYAAHRKRVPNSRMAPFAGYLMPLWFSSIPQEHQAVRTAAGLFDCTHMGVLSITGPRARAFVQTVASNNVEALSPGRAQYAYILDARGHVLDDIIVYLRTENDILMVVNAANAAKIKAYFQDLLRDEIIIDMDDPARSCTAKPKIIDLSQPGPRACVDIALQGPASLEIVQGLLDQDADAVAQLKSFGFMESALDKIPCVIARTGYTGASMGFEFLVHPDQAPALWERLLERGRDMGLMPCGLGARDSLRIEAGLPLYGHELAGPHDISPFEAGYGWAVKLDKPFFIGRDAMKRIRDSYTMQVVRLEIPGGKGVRPVRMHDPVLKTDGACIGWVLSSAAAGDHQIALAYIDRTCAEEGQTLGLYYLARSPGQVKKGRQTQAVKGQSLDADVSGTIARRFAKF